MKKIFKRIYSYVLVMVMTIQLFAGNVLEVSAANDTVTVQSLKAFRAAVNNGTVSTIYVDAEIELTDAVIIKQKKTISCTQKGSLCRSSGNTAEMLVIEKGADITLTNALLDGKGVAANASAICIFDGGSLEMENCTIRRCKNINPQGEKNRPWQGGAIDSNGSLIMTECTIQNNYAAWGGGISVYGSYTAIYGCIFMGNEAIRGGAIFLNEGLTPEDKVIIGKNETGPTTKIYENKAVLGDIYDENGNKVSNGGHGGGIYNQAVAEITLGDGVEIYNNSAYDSGGGICNSKADNKTSSMIINGALVSGNTAQQGGAVYNSSNLTIHDIACSIEEQNKNTADDGGAVYNSFAGILSIKGGTVSGTAHKNGGGIYNAGVVAIEDILLNDSSAINGGGIFNDTNGDLYLKGGTVTKNISEVKGNGVYQSGYFYLSGNAIVDASNDVYLPEGKIIRVKEAITSQDIVATLTPETYANGVKVVQDQYHASADDVYTSFALTPNENYGLNTDGQYIILAADYTVTFDENGGTALAEEDKTKTVTYGETYGALPTPEREAYKFKGWYTEAEGGTRIVARSQVEQEADHTLYAHWTRADNYGYTVYFLDEDITTDLGAKYYLENDTIENYGGWEAYKIAEPLSVDNAGEVGEVLFIQDLILPEITGWKYEASYLGDYLTLSINESQNIVYCLYSRENVSYTIRYLNKNTMEEIKESKTGMNCYGLTLQTTNLIKPEIPGYTYDFASVESLTMGLDESTNVIELYYMPNEQTYTVDYRCAVTNAKLKESEIFFTYMGIKIGLLEIEKPVFQGYGYSHASAETLTIGADNSQNTIILYYTPDVKNYTVEYRCTETGTQIRPADIYPSYMGAEITMDALTKPQIPGYTFVHASADTLTVGYEDACNVLVLYYTPNAQLYTVEYRSATTDKELMEASVYSTYMDKVVSLNEVAKPQIPGYIYKNADRETLTITYDNTWNKFILYYTPDLQTYTVKYQSITTGKELKPTDTFSAYMDTVVSLNEIRKPEISGYTYKNASVDAVVIGNIKERNQVILYYSPNEQTYTVEYRSIKTGKEIKEPICCASYMDEEILLEEVEKPQILGYTYRKADVDSLPIGYDNTLNRIILYYCPNVQTYTVEYRSETTGEILKSEESFSAVMDEVITTSDMKKPELEGCTFTRVSMDTLIIGADNALNRVVLYYAENKYPYIVYYMDEEGNNLAEPKAGQAFFGDWIRENYIPIEGYEMLSEKAYTVQIKAEDNCIIFRYEKVAVDVPTAASVLEEEQPIPTDLEIPLQPVQVVAPVTGDNINSWIYVNCLLIGGASIFYWNRRKRNI